MESLKNPRLGLCLMMFGGILGPDKEEDPDREGHDAPDIFAHGATPFGPLLGLNDDDV